MTNTTTKKKVLITGCSDGGMGAALAVAFQNAGFHVYATARNPAKMAQLSARGIETLTLDVQSDASIAACVAAVPELDILVNNAGMQFLMPLADTDIGEAKKVFDLNVWAHIAVTQAFLPTLLKSQAPRMIVNQTSVGAVSAIPFQGIYNASKSAFAMLSDSLRLELQPFGVRVVDLRTGIVRTNLIRNLQESDRGSLPKGSIYQPAAAVVEKALRQEGFADEGLPAEDWAKAVVQDLTKKTPPPVIWRGQSAFLLRVASLLPFGTLDSTMKKLTGLDQVEKIVKEKSA